MSTARATTTTTPPSSAERRLPGRQRPISGGRRESDPPLTTRACADWMGMGTDYIVGAIKAGELKAECFARPGRRQQYRIHLDEFIAFLTAIGFKRLPKNLP